MVKFGVRRKVNQTRAERDQRSIRKRARGAMKQCNWIGVVNVVDGSGMMGNEMRKSRSGQGMRSQIEQRNTMGERWMRRREETAIGFFGCERSRSQLVRTAEPATKPAENTGIGGTRGGVWRGFVDMEDDGMFDARGVLFEE